jgi:hypothetical protein
MSRINVIQILHKRPDLMLVLTAVLFAATNSQAQTVVSHTRIGGHAEDITYVGSGALKSKIVVLHGYELYGVVNSKKPSGSMDRLFSLKVPAIDALPTGMTYIESEGLFAVVDDSQLKTLSLFDQKGAYKGTRPIQYLGDYVPTHFEGMAYVPSSASTFPDHLIVVVHDDLSQRLEVITRDGVVVSEIYRSDWPESLTDTYIGDVAYLAPNRLLVTTYNSDIWTLDFSGNILSTPLSLPSAYGFEGIVQMSDSRIVATGHPQTLIFFDKNLTRQPESDRNDIIGLNLVDPKGVAWNSATNQLLIAHGFHPAAISAVPTSLDSAAQVVDLAPHGFNSGQRLTYLPIEDLIAVLSPRAILLFKADGTVSGQIDLSAAALGVDLGNSISLTYIPATSEFVVGFNGVGSTLARQVERRTLRVLSRSGTLVRAIDLTSTGTGSVTALAYFEDSGSGRLLILGSAGRTFITDLNGDSRSSSGVLFGEFNSRAKFDIVTRFDIAAITTGPQAGAFAMVDYRSGEIVIFRLN